MQKQYEFIQKGHSEKEAFKLAEEAIAKEEQEAFDQVGSAGFLGRSHWGEQELRPVWGYSPGPLSLLWFRCRS